MNLLEEKKLIQKINLQKYLKALLTKSLTNTKTMGNNLPSLNATKLGK